MKTEHVSLIKALVAAFFLAAAGVFLIFKITQPNGAIVTTDSVDYCQAAHSMSRGQGPVNYLPSGESWIMTEHPPLYSFVLAAGCLFGQDVLDWARWVNAFLFGVSIFLSAYLAFYLSGRPAAAIFSGILFLVFVHFVLAYASIHSEGLFFSFILGTVLLLVRYVEKGGLRLLLMAAVLTSLCLVTRYIGIALALAGGVVVMLKTPGRGWYKIRAAFFYMIVALGLSFFLAVADALKSGLSVKMASSLPPDIAFQGKLFIDALASYFSPESWPLGVRRLLLLIVVVGLSLWVGKFLREKCLRTENGRILTAWQLGCVFMMSYLLVLWGAMLFVRWKLLVEPRYLLPVMLVLIPLISASAWMARGSSARVVRVVLVIFMVMMLVRTCRLAWKFEHDPWRPVLSRPMFIRS